jgi:hypothetical protein
MKVCNHTGRNYEIHEEENNLFVQPSKGFSVPCEETELSTARIE